MATTRATTYGSKMNLDASDMHAEQGVIQPEAPSEIYDGKLPSITENASLQEYDKSISAEIDYTVSSIQRSLDRLSQVRRSSSSFLILLSFSITMLGWIYISNSANDSSVFGKNGAEVVSTIVMLTIVAIYGTDLIRRRREIARLAETTRRQIEEAKQMQMILTSWLDRSKMSEHLRGMLKLRTKTIDILINEARSSSSSISRFLE